MNLKDFMKKMNVGHDIGLPYTSILLGLHSDVILPVPEYMTTYYSNDNAEFIDKLIISRYGNIKLSDDTTEMNRGDFTSLIKGFHKMCGNALTHLYDAFTVEYDMFENFNMYTEVTNKHGEQHESNSNSTSIDNETKSSVEGNEILDKMTTAQEVGSDSQTTINSTKTTTTSQYATDGGVADVVSVEESYEPDGEGHTQTVSNSGNTTTTTVKGTHDGDKVKNVTTNDREDTFSGTEESNGEVTRDEYTDTTTTTSKGNSGVSTTSQALIKQEVDLWDEFAFYEKVFKMLLRYIGAGVFEC